MYNGIIPNSQNVNIVKKCDQLKEENAALGKKITKQSSLSANAKAALEQKATILTKTWATLTNTQQDIKEDNELVRNAQDFEHNFEGKKNGLVKIT
jgi:hypothetical protein